MEDFAAEMEALGKGDADVKGITAAQVIEAFNPAYLEHDTYALFKKVMVQMKPYFMPGAKPSAPVGASSSAPAASAAAGGKKPAAAAAGKAPAPSGALSESASEVVRKCYHIHHEILRKFDPDLYHYLERHQIEPQLYCLRWVRLLLSREFHLEDVLVLWDALFAGSPDFSLVDHMIVAMLIFIREDILNKDYSSCLKRLFKYPPVEDVHIFVTEGIQMSNPTTKAAAMSFSTQGGTKFPPPKPGKAIDKNYYMLYCLI